MTDRPWDHPYETLPGNTACITCGWHGSYIHTEEGWGKYAEDGVVRPPMPPRIPPSRDKVAERRAADPLDVQSGDIEALRRLLPRVAVAYARAGEARASDDFLAGFIRGLARRPAHSRRRRLLVAVAIAGAFLAGMLAAPRSSAQVTPSGLIAAERRGVVETTPEPRTPAPRASGGIDAAPACSGPCPTLTPRPAVVISHEMPDGSGMAGQATWFDVGPGLYGAIRPDLGHKGQLAVVCGGQPFHCLTIPLTDVCACLGRGSDRLIDLSPDAFSSFAPLSQGVIRITLQLVP